MRNSCLAGSARALNAELKVAVTPRNTPLDVVVSDATSHLRMMCGVVCNVNKDAYLQVTPTVVWLTPEELSSAEFDIYTNQKWEIE